MKVEAIVIAVFLCVLSEKQNLLWTPTSTYALWDRGFPGVSDSKESTCSVGDLGSIPRLGRSPGGEHGNPLQYSCL